MKALKILVGAILLASMFGAGYLARGRPRAASAAADGRKVLYYVDPMHPAYKSNNPGIAPDCGMQLEPVYADDGPLAPPASREVLYYRDPQQPEYRADAPGLNPETGNTLEPVYAAGIPPQVPSGAIRIAPERQQAIGVKFATVETTSFARAIRTVGRVAADETRVGHVHTRVEGWIEKVLVDFTGDSVRKGEPMLTIYSPEMLASQQELLLAARARDLMKGNPVAAAERHGESLFEAARRRLQLWELSDAQIDQVLRSGQPIRNVTVFAPLSGVITARNAFPNQKVTPDSDLYTITDLGRVWVLADVFEADAADVRLGSAVTVTVPSLGGARIAARVNYIQPAIDPATRTLQVRLDVANPGLRLKPDMYVNVEFAVSTEPRLTVPAGAVFDTGERQTVFVDRGHGYLEPRQVVVGERAPDRVTIIRGLAAGDRVVASGTFLIDSESQLKTAAAAMSSPAGKAQQHGERK